MLLFALFLVPLVIGSSVPQENILESIITEELQENLRPFDPAHIGDIAQLNVKIKEDTNLLFNYNDVFMVNFSNIECTKVVLPIRSPLVSLTVMQPMVTAYAQNYTVDGTLDGRHFFASGKANISAMNAQYTYTFEVDSWQLFPFSMCIREGSHDVLIDLRVQKMEANYENADALTEKMNNHGSQLFELWQEAVLENTEITVDNINRQFCPDSSDERELELFLAVFIPMGFLLLFCYFIRSMIISTVVQNSNKAEKGVKEAASSILILSKE